MHIFIKFLCLCYKSTRDLYKRKDQSGKSPHPNILKYRSKEHIISRFHMFYAPLHQPIVLRSIRGDVQVFKRSVSKPRCCKFSASPWEVTLQLAFQASMSPANPNLTTHNLPMVRTCVQQMVCKRPYAEESSNTLNSIILAYHNFTVVRLQ